MRTIQNSVGATITLQDTFTDQQISLITKDNTEAPSGYPALYASKYRGKVYITNLVNAVLATYETSPIKRIYFNSYEMAYELRRENNSLVNTYNTRFDAEEAYLCETYPDTYYSGKKYKVIYNNDRETVKSVATFEA